MELGLRKLIVRIPIEFSAILVELEISSSLEVKTFEKVEVETSVREEAETSVRLVQKLSLI